MYNINGNQLREFAQQIYYTKSNLLKMKGGNYSVYRYFQRVLNPAITTGIIGAHTLSNIEKQSDKFLKMTTEPIKAEPLEFSIKSVTNYLLGITESDKIDLKSSQ